MPEEANTLQSEALEGLRRLAAWPVNDAVRLLAQIKELDSDSIAGLDLFGISEIKQTKDGYLEIKFCDRLRAFELLAELGKKAGNIPVVSTFYSALESAAKSACDSDEI